MSTQIHPTALVDAGAHIGHGVTIGAFSIVGPHVRIADNVKIHSHVVIEGQTTIGENTEIYPFAVIGEPPQVVNFKEVPSRVEIGENTVIREHVTIHAGKGVEGSYTQVGNNCYLMVASHVAHDCILGNNVIMANNATIAGHVVVGDFVIIGGLAAIHQFVRIGEHAFIAGTAAVKEDVIPYGTINAERDRLGGLNLMGLKRRGFSREQIHNLRNAYNMLVADDASTLKDRLAKMEEMYPECPAVQRLLEFIKADPNRPLSLPAEAWNSANSDDNGKAA